MSREPAYIRNFKAFADGNPAAEDAVKLDAELYGGSDRARVLMLSSILETALEIFLRNRTRPTLNSDDARLLFDFTGPLGTFGSKIIVGYAFNLYGPDTRHDLDLIRVLRNGFAHSRKPFGFDEPTVIELCNHLMTPTHPHKFLPKRYKEFAPGEDLAALSDWSEAKTRFIGTCYTLTERLLQNASGPNTSGLLDLR